MTKMSTRVNLEFCADIASVRYSFKRDSEKVGRKVVQNETDVGAPLSALKLGDLDMSGAFDKILAVRVI